MLPQKPALTNNRRADRPLDRVPGGVEAPRTTRPGVIPTGWAPPATARTRHLSGG